MKKKIKRLFLYAIFVLSMVVVVPMALVFFFKDEIIQRFIEQANKQVGTPVNVKGVDISIWDDFPNVGIAFHDIYVEDSHAAESPLLIAEKISFYIDPIQFWQGQYAILGLQVVKGKLFLKVNEEGEDNYTVLQHTKDDNELINFNLKNIHFTETNLRYEDKALNQVYDFNSRELYASITATEWYAIMIEGDITVNRIGIGPYEFFRNKPFHTKMAVRYNKAQDNFIIEPSRLTLYQSQFELQGRYTPALLDLTCKGKNTSIQTLLSLLPEKLSKRVSKYESDGRVYFNMSLKRKNKQNNKTAVSIRFGLSNTTLFHRDYPSRLKAVNLKGSFFTPSLNSFSDAYISLKNITGELNGRLFKGNVDIKNLNDPYVKLNFQGDMDIASITHFYPIDGLDSAKGKVRISVSLDGHVESLKDRTNINRFITSGGVTMHDVSFIYGNYKSRFKDLNGTFRFAKNNLMLDSIRGQFGHTDFLVNGLFKNIATFLLFKDQPIGVEADIQSDFIDIDQLFNVGFKQDTSADYKFSISPNLHLNLNYDVNSLQYRRFKPTQLTGNLLIKNQAAILRNIAFHALGGSFLLNSVVDAKDKKTIDLMGSFQLDSVHIDSAFYVFENFGQEFIEDRHLKGKVFADMDLEMTLSEKLILFPKTLLANISAKIEGGELNNFSPLQGLKKYISDDELNHLRFADIKNDILIKNKIIYIPFMEIKSDATTIDISGTHTFDQEIDYRLVMPLRQKKKIDSDEAFGRVEEDTTGKSKLFLKITGTTNDYEIMYDKQAVKEKIMADIKKEATELKEAFRQKGNKKKKTLELETGNYFDWDDTTRVDNE